MAITILELELSKDFRCKYISSMVGFLPNSLPSEVGAPPATPITTEKIYSIMDWFCMDSAVIW